MGERQISGKRAKNVKEDERKVEAAGNGVTKDKTGR